VVEQSDCKIGEIVDIIGAGNKRWKSAPVVVNASARPYNRMLQPEKSGAITRICSFGQSKLNKVW